MVIRLEDIHGIVTNVQVNTNLVPYSYTGVNLNEVEIRGQKIYTASFNPIYTAPSYEHAHIEEPYTYTWRRQLPRGRYFAPDIQGGTTKKFFIGNDRTASMEFVVDNGTGINDIRYFGSLVTNSLSGNYSNEVLGFFYCEVNTIPGIAILSYQTFSDGGATAGRIYNIGWISMNFFQGGRAVPYAMQDPTVNGGGDPSESGGIGTGVLPTPQVNTKTDSTQWTVFPAGSGLHMYLVSPTEISSLVNFLWGKGNAGQAVFNAGGLWERWKNYKFNPIAGILSCHRIPSEMLAVPTNASNIELAGMTFDGSEIMGELAITAPSYASVGTIYGASTGIISIPRPYGSFSDFSRTTVTVYFPFCGTLEIDPALCIGGSIECYYQCDNVNGNLAVQVITTSMYGKKQVAGVMTGNCAYKLPITGNDNGTSTILGSAISGIGNIISMNPGGLISSAAQMITTPKNTIVSGDVSGNVGWLGCLEGFVQVRYGVYLSTVGDVPQSGTQSQGYNDSIGRPSGVTGFVNEFSGYSELICHADSIDYATDEERAEIEEICRTGIIV